MWVNPYVKKGGEYLSLGEFYIIEKITDLNGIPKNDEKCTLRVGRRFKFCAMPQVGDCMLLGYCPREGESYYGYLRTSTVQESQLTLTGGEVVTTLNSIYYLEPTE